MQPGILESAKQASKTEPEASMYIKKEHGVLFLAVTPEE